ncbi:MAG: hypothetical protein KKD74_10920 [Bacteroidetes bacterium]|nr:hypothetical protein [Bacteroidales bacterium]MBU1010639.1 hypothetical protein [Bacteroidota bacterium]
MLKRDHLLFGLLLGAVFALITYGLLLLISIVIPSSQPYFANPRTIYLLACIPNLVFMRLYLVKWKLDKTGQGILLFTFLAVLLVFVLNK